LPALAGIVDEWKRTSSAEVHARIGGRPLAFGRRTAIALVRVLEEALANVSRHASAKKATITFDHDGETATLVVEDDGRGFSPTEARARGALGLATMRERVHGVGGTLVAESHPGGGTRVTARLPVDEPA
jgi:two-component system sensor histidine kinase DegS